MAGIELPSALESEYAIIGALTVEGREGMKKVQHILTKDDFFDKNSSLIWRAAAYLMKRDSEIDIITLTDFLKRKGYFDQVGGGAGISEYSNFYSPGMTVAHAKIVADRATARRMIIASQKIIQKAVEAEDIEKFLYESEQELKGVTKSSARKESKVAVTDLEEWRDIARKTAPDSGQPRGLSLGYDKLDELTEGFEAGEVMVVTGHTKHGKSKLAANLVWNVAQQGKNVMFINTEMTKLQVARRMNGMMNGDTPTKGKIYINDRADLEAFDAIAIMEKAKELGCDMVVIDHLHFFSRSVDNMTAELSKITKSFKEAAVQLELPLMLLCHIKKGDTSKRPTLMDLKDSSSIAQDADIVIAVFRDDRPNATDPFKTEVLRLAHRSAQRAITHIELYGDGIRLLENRPPTTEQQRQWAEDADKMIGEQNAGNGTDSPSVEPSW